MPTTKSRSNSRLLCVSFSTFWHANNGLEMPFGHNVSVQLIQWSGVPLPLTSICGGIAPLPAHPLLFHLHNEHATDAFIESSGIQS